MTPSQLYPVEFLDETLDINATENYDLVVEVSTEGIAITVLDLLRGKYVLFRNYPRAANGITLLQALQEITDSDDFLKRHYRKTIVITPSSDSTLVPSPLYDAELKDQYFRFNVPNPEGVNIISNSLPFPGATVLFSTQRSISEIVTSKWPGLIPWHHSRPLLHHAFTICRSSEDRYLHLHVEKEFITIIIIDRRKLIFCNNFRTSAPGDVSYFLFNVFDKLGIKNNEAIHLSGLIEPYGELHLSILNFSETVKFSSPVIRHSFSYVMDEVPKHRWLTLFTAPSCE